MYYVFEYYYDNGKTTFEIKNESEFKETGLQTDQCYVRKNHDMYITACKTMKDAKKHGKEVLEA